MTRKTWQALGVASALTITVGSADAAITAFLSRTTENDFGDGLAHVLPLSNSGATSIAFTSSGTGQKTMISYNAECTLTGDTSTWVEIDIKVDGVAIAPSSGDNAFCSGIGSGIDGHWSSNVTNVVAKGLAAGEHAVTVEAHGVNIGSGESYRLDDSITILQR